MEISKLLRNLKLNKYESCAYEVILRKGVVCASTISKEGNIPFGKVYETLGNLSKRGLIEIQDTRPKEYKIKNPKIAFHSIFKKREAESENELKNLKKTLIELEEKINDVSLSAEKEKTFWTTAIGGDIEKMVSGIFYEAKNEICMIPYIIDKDSHIKIALLNMPNIAKEIYKSSKRGVKIKIIFPDKFAKRQIRNLKKIKFFKNIIDHVEIKILKNLSPEPFTLIDSNKVILRVNDPLNKNKILAMIKILDGPLCVDLKKKFNEMWKKAEGCDLE